METRRKPIGEILIARGVIDPSQLESALGSQRASGNRLASECLVRGLVEERPLLAALSVQSGVPGAPLTDLVLPLQYLSAVPEVVATRRCVLPVRMDADRVFLALADPDDSELLGEVAFLSKRRVVVCVALHRPLVDAIGRAYAAKRQGELEHRGSCAASEDTGAGPIDLVRPDEVTQVPRDLALPAASGSDADASAADILFDLEGADLEDDIEIAAEAELDASPEGGFEAPQPPAWTETAPRRAPRPRDPQTPLRVLVVEDDDELRALLVRFLRGEGMHVDQAARGLEALSRVRRTPPDVLILDAMLPELHGFEIAKKIRTSEEYGHIPIVMISSEYRGWRIARDLKDSYGVDAFLEKPFKISVLSKTLRRVLAARLRRPPRQRPTAASAREARRAGLERYRAGDLDGAIERFREALQVDPLSARLHFQLSVLYLKKRGAVYKAMQALEEAVALEPEHFAALRSLAILYQRQGFKNKALDIWERALQCSPDDEMRERIRSHLVTLIEADWK